MIQIQHTEVQRDADDISVRSINTTASSIPGGGSGGGGDLTARSSSSRAAKAEQKKQSVMEDWGFKDAKVAQLMMKRAKRMSKGKKASARKEKMKDAMYRLEVAKRKGVGGGFNCIFLVTTTNT